jgi:hypothetical protein
VSVGSSTAALTKRTDLMRYYLIRDTGVEVRRKRPTAVEEGDLVVTSATELDEARLPAKQLLGLLSTLTSESHTKLGDRKKAIERLWTALEKLSDTANQSPTKRESSAPQQSKQAAVIAMLRRPEGATIEAIVAMTGWQPHTVRGAISGALKKKLGLDVVSERSDGGARVYRIAHVG